MAVYFVALICSFLLFLLFGVGLFLQWRKYGWPLFGDNACGMVIFMAPVGVVCYFFMTVLSLIGYYASEWGLMWIALAVSLLGLALIIASVNIRIFYDEDGFTVRNFFGIKRRYSYADVTGRNGDEIRPVIYAGKKKIVSDQAMWDPENSFARKVKAKYRELHNGKELPVIVKKDIFNGNISSPGELIFIYLFITVLIGGFMVWIWWDFRADAPTTERDCVLLEAKVVSFEIDEYFFDPDELVLHCSGDYESFYIYDYVHCLPDAELFMAECEKGTAMSFYVERNEWDREDKWKTLSRIVDENGYEWMSFEDSFVSDERTFRFLMNFLGTFLLIWLAICICSVIVGRNVEKFSRRTVKLFFRPSHVLLYQEEKKRKANNKKKRH